MQCILVYEYALLIANEQRCELSKLFWKKKTLIMTRLCRWLCYCRTYTLICHNSLFLQSLYLHVNISDRAWLNIGKRITYLCQWFPLDDSTSIVWLQNGNILKPYVSYLKIASIWKQAFRPGSNFIILYSGIDLIQ